MALFSCFSYFLSDVNKPEKYCISSTFNTINPVIKVKPPTKTSKRKVDSRTSCGRIDFIKNNDTAMSIPDPKIFPILRMVGRVSPLFGKWFFMPREDRYAVMVFDKLVASASPASPISADKMILRTILTPTVIKVLRTVAKCSQLKNKRVRRFLCRQAQ